MPKTSKQNRRELQQSELRKRIAESARFDHIIRNIEKLEKLDAALETTPVEINKIKVANDQRLKLLSKYLPDLSAITLSGDEDNPLKTENKWIIEVVAPEEPEDNA